MKKRGVGIALIVLISLSLLIIASCGIEKNGKEAHALPTGKIVFVSRDFTDDPENHKWNSIQEGITDAEEGDIVYVFAGTYPENIFITKSIMLLGENSVVDGGGALYAVIVLADNVKIRNMSVAHGSEAGVFIETYSNTTIENCRIYGNSEYGILTSSSHNNTFLNCSLYGNQKGGAYFTVSEENSVLNSEINGGDWGIIFQNCVDCIVENSSLFSHENKSINISNSDGIIITDCTIYESFCAIRLRESQNALIDGCNITENVVGLRIDASSNNTIQNCHISGNIGYGVYAGEHNGTLSQDNIIHHNNIIGNGNNAHDEGVNSWNTHIGNYWSGYIGIDENNDGIGEEPYSIPGGSGKDHNPLMYPIQSPPLFVWIDDDFNSSSPGWGIDQFDEIQQGVNAVMEGGTVYVYNGTYGAVSIEKSLALKGEGNVSLFSTTDGIFIHAGNVGVSGIAIESEENGIKIVNSYNLTIENCVSQGAIFGLYILNSHECSISYSQLYDNVKGIYLSNASHNVMRALSIHNNSYFGMEIAHHSTDNIIFDSLIENNEKYGIYIFQNSNDNKIWHNNFINNTAYDICANEWGSSYEYVFGNYWDDYVGIDTNDDGMGDSPYGIEGGGKENYPLMNKISYPPSFVWVSPLFDATMPGWEVDHFNLIGNATSEVKEGGGCFVFHGTYKENVFVGKRMIITGEDTTAVEGGEGSAFTISAENVTIQHMRVKNCWDDAGIAILAAHAKIYACSIFTNYYGIFIDALNATIEKSEIKENSFIGVWVFASKGVIIKECVIEGNNDGIVFEHTNYASAEKCSISSNSFTGVRLEFSLGNTIYSCDIEKNIYGIYSQNSFGNTIFINNFLENWKHALDNGGNPYDNGSVGNYWDDYTGTDENDDGIGEEPYIIEGNGNVDRYPLVRKKGIPVAYLSYQPAENISTEDSILFLDESVDIDGFIVAWKWDFGDGNASDEKNPTHSYGDNGTYTINLTIWDDDDNIATTTDAIEIANTPPTANFSWTPPLPNDKETVYFLDESVDMDGFIANWSWDFGDGNINYEQNASHVYGDNGNYTITLTVTDDDGDSDTTQKEITVLNVHPTANFSWTPSTPSTSDIIHFIDESVDVDGAITNWNWDFGDGNTSYEQNPSHSYADNGTYAITLVVKDNDNATSVREKNITVANTPPHADFTFSPTSPKDVQTVTFTDFSSDSDGSVVSWHWEFGDGDTSNEREPTHIYPDDGTYFINLTVTDNDDAINKTSQIISVRNDPPKANFYYVPSSPTDLDSVSFHDVSGDSDGNVVSWNWVFGDGNTSTSQNPTHRYLRDGVYTIKLTVTDDDGGSDAYSSSIMITNAPPVVNFSYSPLSPTDLQKVMFKDNSTDADGSAVNWTWDFGDGNMSYEKDATHQYADDGNYTVTLKVRDDDEAVSSLTKEIEVKNVKPIADFTYEPERPRAKQTVTFSDSSVDNDGSVVNWTWDFGDGSTGDGAAMIITHKYGEKGEYTVSLTIEDDDGAHATQQKTIEIREKEEAPGFDIVILIAALGIMFLLWKKRIGIWHRR